MGLGKTITIISLIAATLNRSVFQPSLITMLGPSPKVKSHGTLIICPLSTVQNWEEQLELHVEQGALKLYVYHGGQRVTDPSFLAQFDIVITTYNLLGTEYSKECKGQQFPGAPSSHPSVLQFVDWFRVVLDEAHIIKEVNTVQSKAATALTAERRWCLTGTPVQNKVNSRSGYVFYSL